MSETRSYVQPTRVQIIAFFLNHDQIPVGEHRQVRCEGTVLTNRPDLYVPVWAHQLPGWPDQIVAQSTYEMLQHRALGRPFMVGDLLYFNEHLYVRCRGSFQVVTDTRFNAVVKAKARRWQGQSYLRPLSMSA
jgi:hypothetical protein